MMTTSTLAVRLSISATASATAVPTDSKNEKKICVNVTVFECKGTQVVHFIPFSFSTSTAATTTTVTTAITTTSTSAAASAASFIAATPVIIIIVFELSIWSMIDIVWPT